MREDHRRLFLADAEAKRDEARARWEALEAQRKETGVTPRGWRAAEVDLNFYVGRVAFLSSGEGGSAPTDPA